jgi:hypothetical protein
VEPTFIHLFATDGAASHCRVATGGIKPESALTRQPSRHPAVRTGYAQPVFALLLVVAAYAVLLSVWLARGRPIPNVSILDEDATGTPPFRWLAYARACVVVIATWAVFVLLAGPFHKLMAMRWLALALVGVVFAAGFPLYVLGRLAFRRPDRSATLPP